MDVQSTPYARGTLYVYIYRMLVPPARDRTDQVTDELVHIDWHFPSSPNFNSPSYLAQGVLKVVCR